MRLYEIIILAIGLAMDALAVSICDGLAWKLKTGHKFAIAGSFGVAQAVMPLLGLLAGQAFASFFAKIDHWIALVLLVFLGVKMLWEARKSEQPGEFSAKTLLVQAIATSIDALAVGFSFAALGVEPFSSAGIIGAVTFLISLAGVLVAQKLGAKMNKYAKILGGLILIFIGIKIFVEHAVL